MRSRHGQLHQPILWIQLLKRLQPLDDALSEPLHVFIWVWKQVGREKLPVFLVVTKLAGRQRVNWKQVIKQRRVPMQIVKVLMDSQASLLYNRPHNRAIKWHRIHQLIEPNRPSRRLWMSDPSTPVSDIDEHQLFLLDGFRNVFPLKILCLNVNEPLELWLRGAHRWHYCFFEAQEGGQLIWGFSHWITAYRSWRRVLT